MLNRYIDKMICAKSEEVFNHVLQRAFEMLSRQQVRNANLEESLQQFADRRQNYAQYCLDRTPGTRGLHGSAATEQNHSSLLVFLNDGIDGQNNYCKDSLTLLKDLFRRQWVHTQKWDKRLHGEEKDMNVEIKRLENQVHRYNIDSDRDLLIAARVLCKTEYKR